MSIETEEEVTVPVKVENDVDKVITLLQKELSSRDLRKYGSLIGPVIEVLQRHAGIEHMNPVILASAVIYSRISIVLSTSGDTKEANLRQLLADEVDIVIKNLGTIQSVSLDKQRVRVAINILAYANKIKEDMSSI